MTVECLAVYVLALRDYAQCVDQGARRGCFGEARAVKAGRAAITDESE